MALTNAEKQKRWREKRNALAKEAVQLRNHRDDTVAVGDDKLKSDIDVLARGFGIPASELFARMLLLGWNHFHRGFKRYSGEVANDMVWWLIEMHSKYPDTFNTGAWHGSCGVSSINVLYADRCVPFGRLQDWEAEKASMPAKEWRALDAKRRAQRAKEVEKQRKAAEKEFMEAINRGENPFEVTGACNLEPS